MATPFVLNELKKYNAKATFFCIGKNVVEQPVIYRQIIEEGHRVGNHSFNHLNGWKTEDAVYIHNVMEAKKYIDSNLFRPPYGKATKFQLKLLTKNQQFVPVMWSVLSGDFDLALSKEKCLANVLKNSRDGSVIVCHDSEKAFEKLQFVLPKVLEYFSEKGFSFNKIEL
jgi:peptidoglycan/xylan/chitin deacetylase (PgdA/CDA1 family)